MREPFPAGRHSSNVMYLEDMCTQLIPDFIVWSVGGLGGHMEANLVCPCA